MVTSLRSKWPSARREEGAYLNRYVTDPVAAHARQDKEAVQISSLKGDQISVQGFNPGLGNSRRCDLKGHHIPARQIGPKSFARVSSIWRHFQGAFLSGGYPGLKP